MSEHKTDTPIIRLRPVAADSHAEPARAELVHVDEVTEPGTSPGSEAAARISSLVDKGFRLAEAVIDLGIQVVDSVGAVTQRLVNDRVNAPPSIPLSALRNAQWSRDAAQPAGPAHGPTGPAHGPAPHPAAQDAAPSQVPGPEAFYVSNRLPLMPGSPVAVSLSLSNDSPSAPSHAVLGLSGFTGQETGALLDARAFSVVPPENHIAPMDFEKFSIRGAIPHDQAPDVYAGWILVSGDEELQIPIRLIVGPGHAGPEQP